MFFRMIKKDLKDSKGLNVILLLFMVIVSILAAAGAMLMFVNVRGIKVSQERCNAANGCITYYPSSDGAEEEYLYFLEKIHESCPEAKTAYQEVIEIASTNFDFEGKDADYFRNGSNGFTISAMPREMDLIYDDMDRPFQVENGHISVPRKLSRETGLSVGDSISFTTQMGRVYEFEVSHIHKDPTKDYMARFIISDADYEVISADSPHKLYLMSVQTGCDSDRRSLTMLLQTLYEDPVLKDHVGSAHLDGHVMSNNALVSTLVSMFLMIAAFFMLLIIVFTLRFSIRTAVKKEERELGIMKALGTDSVSFRWLFAAKYIAFATVGGVIGLAAGIFAGRYLMDNFYYNISYPLSGIDLIPPVIAAAAITVLVIIFTMISMRRINRISVMDAIRGETRGESIRHGSFSLNNRKKMSVPLFLALSDILLKFRRYVLLLIAFTAGFIAMMICVQLRETVVSKDFIQNYYTFGELDFFLRESQSLLMDYSFDTGNPVIAERNINEKLKKNNIPAEVTFSKGELAKLIDDKETESVYLEFGFDPSVLRIVKGGRTPKLRNEVLMDKFTAGRYGYVIGDSITVEYNKISEDKLTYSEVREEFIITGFTDRLTAMNQIEIITSEAFDDGVIGSWGIIGCRIDAPESEKPKYAAQIKELFPNNYLPGEEAGSHFLKLYDILFSFMKKMMIIVVAGVLAFLTVMYQSVFMKDEENQIAMLKSCGFDDITVMKWQFIRMMILVIIGAVLAAVLMPTAVTWLTQKVFTGLVGLTVWKFSAGRLSSALWTALIVIVIAAADALVLRGIRSIDIWRIRNE